MHTDKAHSALQFVGYEVASLSFKAIPDVQREKNDEHLNMRPQFERSIVKIDDVHYHLRLSFHLGEEGSGVPFAMDVALIGHFELYDIDNPEDVLHVNATAILFPYLRALVSQLTTLANIPALILPTFNIVEMFREKPQV